LRRKKFHPQWVSRALCTPRRASRGYVMSECFNGGESWAAHEDSTTKLEKPQNRSSM